MPSTLAIGDNSYFLYNGYPVPRGVMPVFDATNGKLSLRYSAHDLSAIMNSSAYSEIINGDTGLAFASEAALIAWVIANVFIKPGTGGGGASSVINENYTIGVGGHNAGSTLTITNAAGVAPIGVMFINDVPYQWVSGGAVYNAGTKTFDFSASTNPQLNNGDQILIL